MLLGKCILTSTCLNKGIAKAFTMQNVTQVYLHLGVLFNIIGVSVATVH